MKVAMNARLILSFGLLALGGARALPAAEVIGDGQAQARLLLSGRGASAGGLESGYVSPLPAAAKSIAIDAQAQAREMVLGRPISKTSIVGANRLRAAGAQRDRQAAAEPQEMARRMILGSESARPAGRLRLSSKTESLDRRIQAQ
jgi:hypothetical protein